MSVEVVGTPMTTLILHVLEEMRSPHCSTTVSGAAGESLHWKTGIGPGGGVITPPSSCPPLLLLHARVATHARTAGPSRRHLMSVPAAGAREHAHEEVKIGQVDAGAEADRLQIEVRKSRDGARIGAGPERVGEHGQIPPIHPGGREIVRIQVRARAERLRLADIADAVAVGVLLTRVPHIGTVVARAAEQIAIAVETRGALVDQSIA